jgi:hypothetical protein
MLRGIPEVRDKMLKRETAHSNLTSMRSGGAAAFQFLRRQLSIREVRRDLVCRAYAIA